MYGFSSKDMCRVSAWLHVPANTSVRYERGLGVAGMRITRRRRIWVTTR
jgi:hypothetical protein